MGWSSTIYVKDSVRWCLGKSVQIKNTWVCATQNGIGIVRHGNSSEDIGAQLSEVDNGGEEEFRSEIAITKLWRPTWNRSSGQKSKGTDRRLKQRKGICYLWKERPMFEGRPVQFWAWELTIVHKNRHRKPLHPLSHQWHEVQVCRGKRSIRGKSNHGVILRQPCRYYFKGTCTRSPCEYWHPHQCQFYKTEAGFKAGDKCLFPHHEVDEQPNKKSKKSYHSHKGRESDDKNAVAIVKIVPQLGCVSQDSGASVSQGGKQSRWNPMQKVLGSIRRVRFTQSTLRQASIRENKGPSLGKIQVKLPHQRSPCAIK